jgi:D-beta-D-heptose 7-phosphate kinase/D-beta-D-heptose 1-phosphate adenosyltransferase
MKIAVFGDFIIDVYNFYSSEKLTPEANVPILKLKETKTYPGGAYLVASLLKDEDFEVDFYTNVGEEKYTTLNPEICVIDAEIESNTTIKQRVILEGKYLHRVDKDIIIEMSKVNSDALIDKFQTNIESYSAVVFADYNKGILNDYLASRVKKISNERNIPTFLDPKPENNINLNDWTFIKPNLPEAVKITGSSNLNEITNFFEKKLQAGLFLTLGKDGCLLSNKGKTYFQKPHSLDYIDLSGCGDAAFSGLIKGVLKNQDETQIIKVAMKESAKVMKQFGPW